MKNILIIGVGVLLLGMTGTFGFLYFTSSKSAQEPAAGAAQPAAPPETFYFPVKPEFIVNFNADSGAQFLMLDVTIASHDSKVPAVLDTHMPELRNDLLMLFSRLATEELYSEEGKAALRTQASESVTTVLQKHYVGGEISDLYFTRFVMQ